MQPIINHEATVYVKHELLSHTLVFLHACNTHMLACKHMLSLQSLTDSSRHRSASLLSRDDMQKGSKENKNYSVNYSKDKSVDCAIEFAKYIKSTWCTV